MDINEVPQDEMNYKDRDKVRKLVYAVGKDGKYTGVNSAGWEAENTAMRQAWELVDEKLSETLEAVKSGKQSPIAFFMEKNLMDVALLAKYVGKWKWTVKKHLTPAGFAKLDTEVLKKYAQVFNVPVEELKNFGK